MPAIVDTLATDSAAIADSIARADSMALDTVKTAAVNILPPAPTGFVGIPLASSVGREPIVPIILLIMALLFGYVTINRIGIVKEITKYFFSSRRRLSIFIDASVGQVQLLISLSFILITSVSMILHSFFFGYQINIAGFDWVLDGMLYLCFIWIGIAVFLGLKYLTIKLLGSIFFEKEQTDAFILGYFTILSGIGLILAPISIAIIYAPTSIHQILYDASVGLGVVAFMLIFYKLAQIFLQKPSSIFYIVLYLCTVEILPLVVLVKIFVR